MKRYEQTTTEDGYEVIFAYTSDNPFSVTVKHGDTFVATSGKFESHTAAARWARKRIREHRKALAILRGT
jgi:hypothetical protein